MDFSARLDDLQQRAADAKAAAQAAVSESREQLRQRIDQARVDADLAAKDARQRVGEAAASARSTWAQLKADAAAKLDDLQARIDKRADQVDTNVANEDAAWAEDDAAAAIDYAAWTVDNARLAVLDAIDARAYANELAAKPAPSPPGGRWERSGGPTRSPGRGHHQPGTASNEPNHLHSVEPTRLPRQRDLTVAGTVHVITAGPVGSAAGLGGCARPRVGRAVIASIQYVDSP